MADLLNSLLQELPSPLRDDVEGYSLSVQAAAPSILREARVRPTKKSVERLVFFGAVRYLWLLVSGQYWLLDNSLSLMKAEEFNAYQVGAARFGRDGKAYEQLRGLFEEFEKKIEDLELTEHVRTSNLVNLAQLLRAGRRAG